MEQDAHEKGTDWLESSRYVIGHFIFNGLGKILKQKCGLFVWFSEYVGCFISVFERVLCQPLSLDFSGKILPFRLLS